MARIAGWNATGTSGQNVPLQVTKAAASGKQHVVTGLDVSFSAAPAANVICSIVNASVSPNSVLWSGYLANNWPGKIFSEGLAVTPGCSVEVQLAGAGGSVIAKVNLTGYTQ